MDGEISRGPLLAEELKAINDGWSEGSSSPEIESRNWLSNTQWSAMKTYI